MTVLLCRVRSFFQQMFLVLLQYARSKNRKMRRPMAGQIVMRTQLKCSLSALAELCRWRKLFSPA